MTPTILLIEDNPEMNQNIAEILKLAHYTVITALNGKAGVELATKHLPNLILCDIMMPGLDGYGVLHILSRNPATANIPFVFLTAKADRQDFREGMNMGADDYITKPFDGLDLLKVIEVRLKKSEHVKSNFANTAIELNQVLNTPLHPKLVEKLKEGHTSRLFKKKEFIYLEGQECTGLYLVNNGEVKTYKANKDGKELIMGIHGAGALTGFISLLNNTPHDDTAVAQTDHTEVYHIGKHEFLDLVYTNSEIARQIIKTLSGYIAEGEDRMIELAYQTVRQRVAGVLLKMNEAHPKSFDLITLSRKDLSGIVGTATESLNRTLLDFKEEGLIEIKDEGIAIKNKQKLQKLHY
jgi:CRP-like cAMP-binding protein/CheY-like chemotaxis protein